MRVPCSPHYLRPPPSSCAVPAAVENTGVELLERFVKVCLPLAKTKKLPKEAPMEHPHLPGFATLGLLTSDVADYYSTQTKNDNKLRLNTWREREKELLMGIWDGSEYTNEVKWPEKTLKEGYKIEMCFSYPEAAKENMSMWCCGIIHRVKSRNDKVIKADIKWDKEFVACGESGVTEKLLKINLWNPEKPKKGTWKQDG